MRHRTLNSTLITAALGLLWSLAMLSSCSNDVVGPATRDTVVVIDTGHPYATVKGNVRVLHGCETRDPSGVRVAIPELNFITFTDSAGNFVIPHHPLRELTYIYSREGVYSKTIKSIPASDADGEFSLGFVSLFEPHNFSGELVGDVSYQQFRVPMVRDSMIIGADGEWYFIKITDTVDYRLAEFEVRTIDEQGQAANSTPVLFVSRKKQIDPKDTTSYLFYVLGEQLHRVTLEHYGIKRYESIYVAAGSVQPCAFNGSAYPGQRCSVAWGVQAP